MVVYSVLTSSSCSSTYRITKYELVLHDLYTQLTVYIRTLEGMNAIIDSYIRELPAGYARQGRMCQ